MNKVLIPTDFSVDSLKLIEHAILNAKQEPIDIVLVYGHRNPGTYWNKLYNSNRQDLRKFCPKEFHDAQQKLLEDHQNEIRSLTLALFEGYNSLSFMDFLEVHECDAAVVPSRNFLKFRKTGSFDPTPFIRKNVDNIEVVELDQRSGASGIPWPSLPNFLG